MSPFEDDLTGAHVAKLEARSRDESVARMEAWFAEGEAAEAEAAPAGPEADAEKPSLTQQITPEEGSGEQWWQTAIRNVSPVEFMGGALDFADNAFETIRQISAKGDEALMAMGIPAYVEGEGFTTDYEKFKGTKNVGDYLPDIGDPEKAGIARSIGKFVAGYATAGRALSGVRSIQTLAQSGRFGQSAVAALKGAMSDFAGMREMEGNLANLIESFPALSNPVTDYLAADEETPELVNKIKTAMVGAGFGMALDGVMAGLRAVRAGRQVQQVTGEMDQLAAGMINEAETSRGMIREALGDPDDARLLIDAGEETAKSADSAAGLTLHHVGGEFEKFDPGFIGKGSGARSGDFFYLSESAAIPGPGSVLSRWNVVSDKVLDATKPMSEQTEAVRESIKRLGKSIGLGGDFSPSEFVSAADEYGLARSEYVDAGIDAIRVGDEWRFANPEALSKAGQATAASALPKAGPANPGLRVGDVYVNLSRIDSEDDVKTVIQDLANRYSDSIDAGRRGVQTFADTQAAAASEDAWSILQNRRQGQPLNDAQTFAVRQLWTSSGGAVKSMAQRVAAGGSAADQIALKKMIAVHATIQEQVIGIRTETARALSQWRIPAGESDQFLGGMGRLLDQMGNDGDVMKIANSINELSAMGREDSVDAFINGASKLDELKKYGEMGSDMVRQLFYFSLLSGPKTHMRNGVSNFAMMLANAADRKGAAILGDILGGQNVPDQEAVAMIRGQVNGVIDAFRISDYAREVAEQQGRTPRSPVVNALMTGEQGMGVSKLEVPKVGAFSHQKLGYDPQSNLGRVMDFIDTVTSSTTRALAASDEVFRTAQYNGQVHALAYRKAWQEAQSGIIAKDAIESRAMELARTPDVSLRMLSQDFAEKSIFANRPSADSKVFGAMRSISQIPVLGKLAMAFSKTPYNIFIETAQRTPLALITKQFQDEIMAGGARADIAWTKFLTGNAALIALADMAVKGNVLGAQRGIGSENSQGEVENLRRMGNMPMSLKTENEDGSVTAVGFRGLEPFSTLIGMAGNIVEILSSDQFDADDKDVEDVVTAASAAIAMQITAPSFMQGLTGMVSFMEDPTRHGESFMERTAGIVVPNALREVAIAMDPTLREVDGMIQAIMAKTPGLSDNLPPNTDRWGTDLTRESGIGKAYDALSPFPVVKTNPTPIDRELERLDLGLAKPMKKQYFDGIPVNMKLHPKEYTRLVKLAGNEMTATVHGNPIRTGAYESQGGGLRDELSAIVEKRHPFSEKYFEADDGPDGGKAQLLQDIVQAFREEAKFHVVMESPALREKLASRYFDKLKTAGDPDLVKPNKFLEIME